jgi:hypothetical protein
VSAVQRAVRIGVVACVSAACLLSAGRLDDAVAVFDYRADLNAAATFNERTYPEIEFLPEGAKVMEDARLWMPEDARYRVVNGPKGSADRASSLRTFLLVLLMPRGQTQVESAPWAFCYGCSPSTLGPGYEVLSDSRHGFLFARRRS